MGRLWGLIIIVIDIIAILDVMKSDRSTEIKVIWALIIIILPILGPVAWYLVSRRYINL